MRERGNGPRDRAEAWARDVYDEAAAHDPERVHAVVRAVLGPERAEVFAWSALPMEALRRLSSALFPAALRGAGLTSKNVSNRRLAALERMF